MPAAHFEKTFQDRTCHICHIVSRFHRGFSKLLRQPPDPREFIGHRPWNYGQCLVSLLGYRGWRYVTVLSHAAVSTTGMNLPDKLALP